MIPNSLLTCLFHLAHASAKPLVISKYGASGDYPGCTDLAYRKAIEDGVDVLDCPVQMSKDGTPFCLSSINLIDSTNVAQTAFSNLTTGIPEIKTGTGIFTFSMAWNDIKTKLRGKFSLDLIWLSCQFSVIGPFLPSYICGSALHKIFNRYYTGVKNYNFLSLFIYGQYRALF